MISDMKSSFKIFLFFLLPFLLCVSEIVFCHNLKNVANLGGPSEVWTCYVAYDWIDWNVLRFHCYCYLHFSLRKYTLL